MDILRNANPHDLNADYFDDDALKVASNLLGKVLQVRNGELWLMARVIETEAYYKNEKASHSSLGRTHARRALFATPGTIYMYYARGGDSLNFSCKGEGNAVLIKSAYPVAPSAGNDESIKEMLRNNPSRDGTPRPINKLCAGQTLLCSSLGLKVTDWNDQQLDPDRFRLVDDGYRPGKVIQTTRLGIRPDRDAHLPYRFIDLDYSASSTKNPLTVRNWQINRDYTILTA